MKQISPREARQGREGRPVLIILLVSIVAAFAVWFLLEVYGEIIAPDNPSNSEETLPPATTQPVPPASGDGQ
ncbi:hypothetical protein DKP76_06900 [Falsochrobactrum shanghaiense]|uniref:Uncharacterized protein n=1 Tax=Falsochrobactrum shanghaiense TaxID=2201899 RepID=A0A316JA00_9HYPH|nr:hypothetical protein [Falsochrobactrum shanghaiense]PWL18787.1 hypothetical protein DKP76_06900 [Falsochrobactrum shanghaiense]